LQFAFKTPTLRNIALTAPYMHNGIFETLEEVVDFYDRGGGVGRGLKLDHQTLPETPLQLTEMEKKQLILFLKTLTDNRY
jgi:cytochrome c peroxidase